MAGRLGAMPVVSRTRIMAFLTGAVLIGAAVLAGCAAPTPVYLGTVPASPDVTTGPATAYAAPTVEPAAPTTVPHVPPPVTVRSPAGAPDPPLDPSPVTYPPPVTVPDPVLPPVTVPAAPPVGPGAIDLLSAVADAERVVGGYWARHWGERFTGSYAPPRVVGLYDGTGQDVPTCGGQPLPPYNAAYCTVEDYLAWDITLMGLRSQIGDSWPYLVVAHEWGHAIQWRLDTSLNALALELQADCLAGAALYGAVADGTLVLGDDAAREIATALAAASDETPWTDVSDHGNAAERTGAFDAGRAGGVRACLPGQ